MKTEELTNYCKNNLGIDLVYYSGKNSMECAVFIGDYRFSLGKENGCLYLNFPRKNVYLHGGEYIIKYGKRFIYTGKSMLQKIIDLCHHVENPDGSYCEVIKCPQMDNYQNADLLYTLIDYMGLRLNIFQVRGYYEFVDPKTNRQFKLKPNDLFIIKPDGYSMVKEEDIPMSPLEEDSFLEECEIWSDYDAEDLNCIAMHGMTCLEYQTLLEDIEYEHKSILMYAKETHEARWDIIDEF